VAPDLVPRLRQLLTNIEVAFAIEEDVVDKDTSRKTPVIEVIDTTDAEGEFIMRMLQRSGYNVEVTL
jgi:hypothetical protein